MLKLFSTMVASSTWKPLSSTGLLSGDVHLKDGGFRAGHVCDGDGAQPKGADDFLQVRGLGGVIGHRFDHGCQIAERLFPQRPVLLVRHRIEQRADPRLLVVEPEIGCRQNRGGLASALEQIGEDAD